MRRRWSYLLGLVLLSQSPSIAFAQEESTVFLMSHGVSAGGALAVVTEWEPSDTEINTWKSTFMPYVILVPAYWLWKADRRECAAQWSGLASREPSESCIPHKFGIVVGRPLNFDASITLESTKEERLRRVSPQFFLGVTFSPNAYASAGFGVSYVTVPVSVTVKDNELPNEEYFWAGTFFLGLNLDIVRPMIR